MARQSEQINITALARMLHSTTPKARVKLQSMGLEPSMEIPMPSGRRYVVYDKTTAIRAIEKFQKAKEAEAEKARKQSEKEQTAKQAQEAKQVKETVQEDSTGPAKAAPEAASEIDTMRQEVQQMRTLMEQILEAVTKPGIEAKKD